MPLQVWELRELLKGYYDLGEIEFVVHLSEQATQREAIDTDGKPVNWDARLTFEKIQRDDRGIRIKFIVE